MNTDAGLLEQIRTTLAVSPFHGEGHRRISARLRIQGVHTSKPRVLHLMRENEMLALQRQLTPAGEEPHAGSIVTGEPSQR
jgi:hypothetical protein